MVNAKVDLERRAATVTFDPDKADPIALVKATADAGIRLPFTGDLSMRAVTLESVLMCPRCGFAKAETMPTDACQFYYECENCKALLRPRPGDCCVFCSYGSVKCPPIQQSSSCGGHDGSRVSCCPAP